MKERRDELGYEPTEHAIPTGSARELRGRSSSVRELDPAGRASPALAWLHPGSTLAAGRFEIVRLLGMGGMGVVYAALDTQRASQVALKTLHRADAVGIYRFKNEFGLGPGAAPPAGAAHAGRAAVDPVRAPRTRGAIPGCPACARR